ncbi:hypothetical protein ACS0TY_000277 [Phlomoides rotata]
MENRKLGYLGAIDGTYVNVNVPEADKGRYRTRKGIISTNVLAACDRNCMFTYILPGWEVRLLMPECCEILSQGFMV